MHPMDRSVRTITLINDDTPRSIFFPLKKEISAYHHFHQGWYAPIHSFFLLKKEAMVIISHEYDERLPSFSIDSSSSSQSSLSPLRFSLENDYPEAFKKMNQVVEKLDTLFSKGEEIEEETNSEIVQNRCSRWWRLLFSRFEKMETIEDNGNSNIRKGKEQAATFVTFLRIVRDIRKSNERSNQ